MTKLINIQLLFIRLYDHLYKKTIVFFKLYVLSLIHGSSHKCEGGSSCPAIRSMDLNLCFTVFFPFSFATLNLDFGNFVRLIQSQ